MGFGRGKGFTSKVREIMARYVVRGGGGKRTKTHIEQNPTHTASL